MKTNTTRAATHAWWVSSLPELDDLCPLQLILGQGRLAVGAPEPTSQQKAMLAEPWNKRYARLLDVQTAHGQEVTGLAEMTKNEAASVAWKEEFAKAAMEYRSAYLGGVPMAYANLLRVAQAAPAASVAQWTDDVDANAALLMLDRLDVSADDDVRVDAIAATIRRLAQSAHTASVAQLTDEQIEEVVRRAEAQVGMSREAWDCVSAGEIARAILAQAAPPAAPVQGVLTDEQIVILRRETYQGAHAPRASDLAFARAVLAQAAPPAAPVQGDALTQDALRAALQLIAETFHGQTGTAATMQGIARSTLLAAPAAPASNPVGHAGSMPGTDGFTMACFKAVDVPIGTALYAAPAEPDTFERARAIVETWPGWKRNFTLTPYSTPASAAPATGESGAEPVGKLVVNGLLHEWHPANAAFDLPSGNHLVYATPPAAEAASQPGEIGAGVPTECQTVFGEPCQYARDIASGRVHCIHCDRDKPASAQQDEREAVTDAMVYAFHRSMSDGSLGEADFNEIRDGLRAALIAAPQIQATGEPIYQWRGSSDAWIDCDAAKYAEVGHGIANAKPGTYGSSWERRIVYAAQQVQADAVAVPERMACPGQIFGERRAFAGGWNACLDAVDAALSREQSQPSNGDREGGA